MISGRNSPLLNKMAVKLDEIRERAQHVASSLGLDVVDVEFAASGHERVLRVLLEKNAEGRAALKAKIEAAKESGQNSEALEETSPEATSLDELPEALREGSLSVEQLSGVTHEDCAAFSRDFSVVLDVEDLVPGGEYLLEASSPGLDRKLARPEDFARFQGSMVKIQTFEPIKNNRHWQGRLTETTSDGIRIDLNAIKQNSKSRKAGVTTVEIAFSNIEKAQLIPEI